MRILQSLAKLTGARRWAPLMGALGLLALCSGCVVYTGGGGWHDRGGGYYHYR